MSILNLHVLTGKRYTLSDKACTGVAISAAMRGFEMLICAVFVNQHATVMRALLAS